MATNIWRHFKVIMTHNENIKSSKVISNQLEMEEEHIKTYAPPNVAFNAKGCGPKGKRHCPGKKPKKGPHPSQDSSSKCCFAKKQHKAKSTGAKDMARVKCYNYGKKRHFVQNY